MFKQLNPVKVLALVAAVLTGSHAFAAGPNAGKNATDTKKAHAAYGAVGAYAYDSTATTPSSVVTAPTIMALKTMKILGLVSAVAAEAVSAMQGSDTASTAVGGDSGVKLAGSTGSAHKASMWVRASRADINNAEKDQEWNGASHLLMIGADYRFNKMFCFGAGLSYSRLDARTEFNKGTQIEDTFGVNPYLIIVPHKNFNIEIVGGASWTKGKDDRRWIVVNQDPQFAVAQNIDNVFKSSPKSQSMFGGIFANFVNTVGKANFGLQVGYLTMQTKFSAFKETSADARFSRFAKDVPANTFKADTLTGKLKAGYQMTPSVAPFLTLHTQYDVKENKGVSYSEGNQKAYKVNRSAFGGGAGLGFKGDDALSGSVEVDYTKRGKMSAFVSGVRVHYGF